ncbi:hypothetical protein DFJ63DRAFT_337877 [Scheffersomyces coipomensis]|uniref:uncharacterized protein n=1 Tax=Scheffersomyces coipomensis TaxID=1788519 RepID=UPI00315C9F29
MTTTEHNYNSTQVETKLDESTLPDKLKGTTNLVILDDSTFTDSLDNLLIPPVPTEGQILYHNKPSASYEESSQLFFDNAHKFNNPDSPLVITLQFKLGSNDDGKSMNDLISKANIINMMGNFKFKLYIFKIVIDKQPDKFKLPPVEDLTPLKRNEDVAMYNKLEVDYKERHSCQPKISISWLGPEIQELHLGQKVRLDVFIKRDYPTKFPNLETVGFESYYAGTVWTMGELVKSNGSLIKTITLGSMRSVLLENLPVLQKCTVRGYELRHYRRMMELMRSSEVIHYYGEKFDYFDHQCRMYRKKHPDLDFYYSFNIDEKPTRIPSPCEDGDPIPRTFGTEFPYWDEEIPAPFLPPGMICYLNGARP